MQRGNLRVGYGILYVENNVAIGVPVNHWLVELEL